jgi:large subunit ribosomal protein L23
MSHKRAASLLKDAYAIVRRPILTEKTHAQLPVRMEAGKEDRARYTFDVHLKATKPQIKRAIEMAFGVKVDSVNTILVKPRAKSFRTVTGRGGTGFSRQRKKAIVRLAKGSKMIDLI